MKERPPVDKYSKSAYEEGVVRLSQIEKNIKEHPLQAELAVHQELKKEAPTPYPLRGEEENIRTTLKNQTAVFQKEIDTIKKELWRQLGNAQTEAKTKNDEIESQKLARAVLPQIIKIEDNTHHRMEDSGNLSQRAHAFGRAVLAESENAKRRITSKKPMPSPTMIQTSFRVIQELYREFSGLAGNVLLQDKYGGDVSGPMAT